MKLSEAWRLSHVSYRESVYRSLAEEKGRMWWGAFRQGRESGQVQDDVELAKKALRIAKFDKILVAFFNAIVSLVPFASLFFDSSVSGLASSVALSLAVSFGLIVLYAVQTLSSFVGAESSILLSTLPITREGFSLINLLLFIRSIDYIVIGAVISQVLVVAYLTGSVFAMIIMLGASMMNVVFAFSVALWFSRVFQKNLLRGGRSKANTVLRLVFIMMWGLLLIGVGFLLSIPYYIMPNLENALLGVNQLSSLLLGLVYPFSTGIIIANLTYSSITVTTVLLASAALVGSALLAIFAGGWSLKTVKTISQGFGVRVTRITTRDFSVKLQSPLLGYIFKDLKVASRNPSTAFFFAMPILETLIIVFLFSNSPILKTSTILTGSAMGGIFALFLPLALITAEGKGLEYTKTLPVSPCKIIISKALVATAAYVPVPMALVALSLVKPSTSLTSILIPFIILMGVHCASTFEVKLFLNATSKGKIAALVNDAQKLFIGLLTVLLPEVAYATVFLLSFDYGFALLAMGLVALVEIGLAVKMIK